MWICNGKYTEETSYGGDKCKTANLRQEWLEHGYMYAIQKISPKKRQIIGKCGRRISQIERRLESGEIEKELALIEAETTEMDKQIAALEDERELTFGDHADYDQKCATLKAKGDEIVSKKAALENERDKLSAELKTLQDFVKAFEALLETPVKFSGKNFIETIDRVEVSQFILAYHFYGGECVKVNVNLLKKMC